MERNGVGTQFDSLFSLLHRQPLHGVEDDMPLGAGVGDDDFGGFIRGEAVGAEREEQAVARRLFLLVDGEGGFAGGVADGDGDGFGAVGVGRVGEADFVAARAGELDAEDGRALAFGRGAVVQVARANPLALRGAVCPVAG